jgi:gamma-glutamyltranspeptidase/glutathione hydrolase
VGDAWQTARVRHRADGSSWAIATPHAAATEAGAEAFERGGNAVDAALSAAISLAVVYPHMCGVGGDLFALVQMPDGRAWALNSSGRAPSGLDAEALRRVHGSMPEHGPPTVTVPGAVAGWWAMHGLGGRRAWRDAFDAALPLAFEGAEVAPGLAESLAWQTERLASDPGMAAVFFPGGVIPVAGDTVRQPALGATLEAIGRGGGDVFYTGAIGHRYAAGLRDLGVAITDEDLASHRADQLPPLATSYRDLHVSVAPPNSQGFVLLEILALLERLALDPDPNGADAGRLALVARAAGADRDLHLADPDSMTVHPHTLLDDGHLAGLADGIRGRHVPNTDHARSRGDTIALVAADAEGHAVSLIQSLFDGFGSGLLEPSTGIVAHSRGACFTLVPGHPNEAAPGKRPAHTLMPVLVHRDGHLAAVAGAMGGYAQPQINAITLIRSFDLGLHPSDAVAAPRWLVSGPEDRMDREVGGQFLAIAERDVSAEARTSLGSVGCTLEDLDRSDGSVGHAHLIRISSQGLQAGADPRSDGSAMAV